MTWVMVGNKKQLPHYVLNDRNGNLIAGILCLGKKKWLAEFSGYGDPDDPTEWAELGEFDTKKKAFSAVEDEVASWEN